MMELGPFSIEHLAGSGAFAYVWKGRHRATDTPVAIKVIPLFEGASEKQVYRFRAEVRAVARIVHPGVIAILDEGVVERPDLLTDVEIAPGSPYIAMEWADGGSLDQRVGDLDWRRLRSYLLGLLDALAAAHARGVIHRDIKPQNILFSQDRLLLADFGVAFDPESDEPDGELRQMFGSPNYMSPEQILCRWRDFGPWTDLYAVGCVAWRLVTGRAPFGDRESYKAVLKAHLKRRLPAFEPRFQVPPEFEAWCRHLLRKNPYDRFQFAADAASQLLSLKLKSKITNRLVSPRTSLPITLDDVPVLSDKTLTDPPVFVPPSEMEWAASSFEPTALPPVPVNWFRPSGNADREALIGTGLRVFESAATELIGRHDERDRLWQGLRRSFSQFVSSAFVIQGKPGTGKTALQRWFACRAHEVGASQLALIQNHQGEDGLGSVRDFLAALLRCEGMEPGPRYERIKKRLERFDAGNLAPDLAAIFETDLRFHLDDVLAELRSFKEVAAVIAQLLALFSARRPLIVVIDDGQWGAPALELLDYCLGQRDDLRVVWVVTWRMNAPMVQPRASELVEQVKNMTGTTTLHLSALSYQESERLIQSRLRLDQASIQALVKRAQGNPLFAEQLVQHWISQNQLTDTDDGFRVIEGNFPTLPDSLTRVWQERLESLGLQIGESAGVNLALASMLGQRFSFSVWAAACERFGEDPTRSLLATLERNELLIRIGEDQFEFAHALLREAIEQASRLQHWWYLGHRVCAETLTELIDPPWDRIARHYRLAALDALAADAYGRYLKPKMLPIGHRQKAQVIVEMAGCLKRSGVRRDGLDWARLLVQWSYSQRNLGRVQQSYRHIRRARRILEQHDDIQLLAEAAASEAQTTKFVVGHGAGSALMVEAIRYARASQDNQILFSVLKVGSSLAREAAQQDLSAQHFAELSALMSGSWIDDVDEAERAGLWVDYYFESSEQHLALGQHEAALTAVSQGFEVAKQAGRRTSMGILSWNKGRILLMLKRFEDAEAVYEETCDLFRKSGSADELSALGYMAVCSLELGRYEESLERRTKALDGLAACGRVLSARLGRPMTIGTEARLNLWDDVEASLEDFESLVKTKGYAVTWGRFVEMNVRHLIEMGGVEQAKRLLSSLRLAYEQQSSDSDLKRIERVLEAIESSEAPSP